MTYDVTHGHLSTRIDMWYPDGRLYRTVYVHRAEYRHWNA